MSSLQSASFKHSGLVGLALGDLDGFEVGKGVGLEDGEAVVGEFVGFTLGDFEGELVGLIVGNLDG